jgi:multiple antibiotic resistance protein
VGWSAEATQGLITFLATLLVITDPLGNLPLFLLFTEPCSPGEQRRVAAIATSVAAGILTFFALTGNLVLRLFAIELPAFQIAGGLIFLIYALQMLRLIPSGIKTSAPERQEGLASEHVALVPLAIPLVAGPGAITTVLVWRERVAGDLGPTILVAGIVAVCLVVFAVFAAGRQLRRLLGIGGIRVVERLMGLFLAVIAVQFIVSGIQRIG